MMKRVIACVVVMVMAMPVVPAFSQTSAVGPSGTSTAVVDSSLEFSMKVVKKMESGQTDPWNQGTDVSASPSFDFGKLVPVTDSTGKFLYMRGTYFYYVLMLASTSGRAYKITETGTQMTNTSTGKSLANESVLMVPDYQWSDKFDKNSTVTQGAPPGTAYVGAATSACLTDSLVYQSDVDGKGRIVRAAIGIGGPSSGNYPSNYKYGMNDSTGQLPKQEYTSWKPVTQDQAAGTYKGSVTFTLVLT
jgi:hypothetical protein